MLVCTSGQCSAFLSDHDTAVAGVHIGEGSKHIGPGRCRIAHFVMICHVVPRFSLHYWEEELSAMVKSGEGVGSLYKKAARAMQLTLDSGVVKCTKVNYRGTSHHQTHSVINYIQ